VLLILLLLFILLCFGAGFTAHILWWGILIGVILLIASTISGTRL
jgi:hypothetical protein